MFYHQKNTCYETHTRMVVGTNCIEQLPEEIKACGGEKAVARRGRMWYNGCEKYDAGGAGYGIAVV